MAFHLIDIQNWSRREFYEHFIHEVACSYSTTVHLDITCLKEYKLYPSMLWLLTKTVNELPQFRTALTEDGLGFYDDMHPSYTIFNKENKNFSGIWITFDPDYHVFLSSYQADTVKYASSTQFSPKPNRPPNSFDVSMVPWFSFSSFHINVHNQVNYLLPIFTLGKYFDDNEKRILPLAIQVHHAVCDGYHVGKFIELLQDQIHQFPQ